jgi:hypothetical protein
MKVAIVYLLGNRCAITAESLCYKIAVFILKFSRCFEK